MKTLIYSFCIFSLFCFIQTVPLENSASNLNTDEVPGVVIEPNGHVIKDSSNENDAATTISSDDPNESTTAEDIDTTTENPTSPTLESSTPTSAVKAANDKITDGSTTLLHVSSNHLASASTKSHETTTKSASGFKCSIILITLLAFLPFKLIN